MPLVRHRAKQAQVLCAPGTQRADRLAQKLRRQPAAAVLRQQGKMQQRALIAVQAARGDHPGGGIAQHGNANAVARLRLRAAKRGQQGSVLRSYVAIPHIEIQIAAAAPPVLAAERRKLRRQVRSVVQRDQLIAAVFPVQLRDGRVFTVADAFVLPGEEQLYQRAAQDHAVRENGDGLPFVTADDVVQPGKEAVCILQEALRALHIPMVGIVREGVQLRGITSLQLAKRRVLPRAEADLAEARVAVEPAGPSAGRWPSPSGRCASDRWHRPRRRGCLQSAAPAPRSGGGRSASRRNHIGRGCGGRHCPPPPRAGSGRLLS